MDYLSSSARGKAQRSAQFEEIYHRHIAMVYRVCLSYLKNRDDAEDAAAEVFFRLWRSNNESLILRLASSEALSPRSNTVLQYL